MRILVTQPNMNSNWDNFLKNLGEWHGSFTNVSIDGEILDSTSSILNLTGLEDNKLVTFRLRRFPAGGNGEQPTSDTRAEYRSLGKQAIFFDTGAFSKGSLQVAPFAEFGAEYGFVSPNRRLRFVQLFAGGAQGNFTSLILIREFRSGTDAPERPMLDVEQLFGKWDGLAHTVYADWKPPETIATSLIIRDLGNRRLEQELSFGGRKISSTAKIQGNQLNFEGDIPRRILLLPDGGSSNTPLQISHRQPFFVETGWLLDDNQRQRLMRSYNDKGEWVSSTHIIEHRV
jgi:Domain of unknown function (DUF3598)